jgi:RNA polymerase sigma-70 factor (ECF subfamily)
MFGFNASVAEADDRDLLRRVAKGDRVAFRALYDRYAGRVFAAARRLVMNVEAEEIVQEAFLDVWNQASTFDETRGSAASWILSVGRNRAIDRLRRSATQRRTVEGLAREHQIHSAVARPDRDFDRGQDKSRVTKALQTLSREQRTVVELAYFDGLSQAEIAARTGDPLGTVKGRARAALATLSRELGEEER